jgi:hypothetical protein
MARSDRNAWLPGGPDDLKTEEVVVDFPNSGDTVLVRGLPAGYSNRANQEAVAMVTDRNGQQRSTVDVEKLEAIKFAAGMVEPTFSVDEAQQVQEKLGPTWNKVLQAIDRLSGIDEEAVKKAQDTFPVAERHRNGSEEAGVVEPAEGRS